jgi:hypothetical protein
MTRLSTCGRCGGTIERRPGSVYGWGHVTETARNADGHRPDPDDGHASSPDQEDHCTCLPYAAGGDGPERDCPVHGECPACQHPAHGEDGCDAWWIAPGTADVEVACRCAGASTAEEAAETRTPAPFAVTPDPWLDPSHPAHVPPF